MGIIALALSILGVFALAGELWGGQRRWLSLVVVPLGLLAIVAIPYGTYAVAIGSVVLFQRTRTARMLRIANGEDVEDNIEDVFD